MGSKDARSARNENDARRELAAFEQSGPSVAAYCRDSGVGEKRLRRWKSRLEMTDASGFRELRVVAKPPIERSVEAEFVSDVLVGRYLLRVPPCSG